MKQIKCAE